MKLVPILEVGYDKGGVKALLKFFRSSEGKEFSDYTPDEQKAKWGDTYIPKTEIFARFKNDLVHSISHHSTRGWTVWGTTEELATDIPENEFIDSMHIYGRIF